MPVPSNEAMDRGTDAGSQATTTVLVWWICPSMPPEVGVVVRHATTQPPGALVHGQTITALGGCVFKVPMATPNDRVPKSKLVQRRCPDCHQEVTKLRAQEKNWDF